MIINYQWILLVLRALMSHTNNIVHNKGYCDVGINIKITTTATFRILYHAIRTLRRRNKHTTK